MIRGILFAAAAVLISPVAVSAREPQAAQAIQQLADGIVDKAPTTYFALATELYREGQKDEAAFWYYVGLIRYRAWMLAKGKDAESSDEQYHFYMLTHSVGQSIYQHVDRDSEKIKLSPDSFKPEPTSGRGLISW